MIDKRTRCLLCIQADCEELSALQFSDFNLL